MAEDRQEVRKLVEEACQAGCRKAKACEVLGVSVRTLQRWQREGLGDRRVGSRARPANALGETERQQIRELLVSPAYRDLSPKQIVPRLADEGLYVASESTFYRILREERMDRHRQRSQPATMKRPNSYCASGPNEVWSWDISYLPTLVSGMFLYLYLMVDIYSRKIVAWQVHDRESAEYASELITEACFVEKVKHDQVVLHSDNGAPMKGATLLARLQELGVMPSFSRPSVSDDNAFSEALFRTLKYRPWYPEKPFADIDEARRWVEGFVYWYNHQHLHSGIRFVTPQDRHDGNDKAILASRHQVYQEARQRHPERWSGATRNWNPLGAVFLNNTVEKRQTDSSHRSLEEAA